MDVYRWAKFRATGEQVFVLQIKNNLAEVEVTSGTRTGWVDLQHLEIDEYGPDIELEPEGEPLPEETAA